MTVAERLRAIVDALPAGAAVSLPTDAVRAWLVDEPSSLASSPSTGPAPAIVNAPAAWRERLWTCPDDTRLGARELAQALDRSRDWVYRAVNAAAAAEKGRDPLPCTRLDGVLVFTAGGVRAWLKASESIVNPEARRPLLHVERAKRVAP
jgi:hypothetical protein